MANDDAHLSGAVAGLITEVCLHPFDTVRARLQTASKMYRGVGDALLTVSKTEGPQALYRGFPIVMMLSSPAHALYFGTYETAKEYLPRLVPSFRHSSSSPPPLALSLTCGMIADMAGELLWTPCDVLKQRQQIQTTRASHYQSVWSGAMHIARTEGVSAFFKGYWLGVATLESPLYFTLYEQLIHLGLVLCQRPRDQLPLPVVSAASFCATAIAAIVTNPLDVLRTRLMVSTESCRSPAQMRALARHICQREGYQAFIKGAPARVLYLAPNHCLSMTAFEFIRRKCQGSRLEFLNTF
eukprot:TRINITY_DN7864_c0_g1_i1.p1 TRINITY_DN7864_c0_g1~~TRINITY_DN7864_c0_g1_i1.p1  ORF type:complete len:306 (-),score=53.26 TRINITY_DN7864_c0_g1_i1:161-1054(-)